MEAHIKKIKEMFNKHLDKKKKQMRKQLRTRFLESVAMALEYSANSMNMANKHLKSSEAPMK